MGMPPGLVLAEQYQGAVGSLQQHRDRDRIMSPMAMCKMNQASGSLAEPQVGVPGSVSGSSMTGFTMYIDRSPKPNYVTTRG